MEEQVLVVARTALESVGIFQGLTFDTQRYVREIFSPGTPRFMPRSRAETDPAFKQLIPYVIMTCGGRYLSYVRGKRAGEGRLVGNRSIGIGGHINPADDAPLLSADLREAYFTAVTREVAEEVIVDTPHRDRIVALINDDSTDVGRVHLGIVHVWMLDEPRVTKREQMLTQVSFMTADELRAAADSLETWSRICLDQLDELIRRCA